MNNIIDDAVITRTVRSLARARARQSFFPDDPVPLAAMPEAVKPTIVRDVALFFGLEERDAAISPAGDDYPLWAKRIRRAIHAKTGVTLTFVTSGSTGRPCPHTFSLEELVTEAEALQPFFADRRRVLSVMPVHHVYGFAFAAMLPQLLRIPVRETPPLPCADFFRELREGDMVLAFPLFWKSFLEMCSGPFAIPCPANLHGVTSGAPCPPEVIEGLLAAAGHTGEPLVSGMTEIYGATEFGAVGLRRQCRGPYTLLSHWQRISLPPEAEGDGAAWSIARKNGPALSLPDEIAWEDERRFIPLRRKDHAVQVGGVNVFPAQVADILRRHPKVHACAVRMMRPEEGVRLKAFVVPSDDNAPGEKASGRGLARELRRWLAARLDTASMPKSFSFGPALPRTLSGKLADWDSDQPRAKAEQCNKKSR